MARHLAQILNLLSESPPLMAIFPPHTGGFGLAGGTRNGRLHASHPVPAWNGRALQLEVHYYTASTHNLHT